MKLIEKINNITWKVIFVYALTMIFLFSLVYYFISSFDPANGLSAGQVDLMTALYFSIVTFSSLGYGDIVPVGYSRLIAMAEVILGLLFIGTLVSKLVSMRQERLLTRLYRMEYISHFRSIRLELASRQHALEEASLKLFHAPDDKEHLNEVEELFKGKTNIIREINSTLTGLIGFFEAEKRREEPILINLDVYHFERLMSSLGLTLKTILTALERFKRIKYKKWKTKTIQQDLTLMVGYSNKVIGLVLKEKKADELKSAHAEIKQLLQELKKESV
jgi:hypothetical protein